MGAKENARKQIDAADYKIASIVAQFNMVADPDNISRYQEKHNIVAPIATTHMWAKNAPREILYIVTDFLDMSAITDEQKALLPELADALTERFRAVEGVVLEKKAAGETDSYDEERHNLVVERGAQWIKESTGNPELGRRVFDAIASEFVAMQNQYLQDETGPIADYIEARRQTPPATGWFTRP